MMPNCSGYILLLNIYGAISKKKNGTNEYVCLYVEILYTVRATERNYNVSSYENERKEVKLKWR